MMMDNEDGDVGEEDNDVKNVGEYWVRVLQCQSTTPDRNHRAQSIDHEYLLTIEAFRCLMEDV